MKWPFAFAALSATALSVVAEEVLGRASVIDGGTFEIRGVRIRLWGIDAPESDQLCRGENSIQYRCDAKAAMNWMPSCGPSRGVCARGPRSIWTHSCDLFG